MGSGLGPQQIQRRLAEMGIKARLMRGGRCVLASLRLSPQPFPTLSGPVRIGNAVFSWVGADRIKCLRPRALFQLPLIRVIDCQSAGEIEARIRLAWQQHVERMQQTERWLAGLGIQTERREERSVLAFPLPGEDPRARVFALEPRRVVLPSAGPLSGVALSRAEDRLMRVDAAVDSSVDLEIAIATRLEEMARLDRRLRDEERRQSLKQANAALPATAGDTVSGAGARRVGSGHRILLVGPKLAAQRTCIESLRLRGYSVHTARSAQRAMDLLAETSPELVFVDVRLDRDDGVELIPSLRQAPGVEEIPVVLVDEQRRPARREAARRAGAAGYLVYPIDVARIAKRVEQLVFQPRRRRFTRYGRRLAARVEGMRDDCLVTALGRGGMFVSTDEHLPTRSLRRCRISIPELGGHLKVEAEVLYRVSATGNAQRGVGLRFHAFPARHEPLLIRYLASLGHAGGAPAPA